MFARLNTLINEFISRSLKIWIHLYFMQVTTLTTKSPVTLIVS